MAHQPLFTTTSAAHTIPPHRFFVLAREGKAFPIAIHHLVRFGYLSELFLDWPLSNEGGDEVASPSTLRLRSVELDPLMFTDDAVAIVAGYCRLAAFTPSSDIPRDVDRFMQSLCDAERSFLATTFPQSVAAAAVKFAFEAVKLAEFLQFEDLKALLCGFVATQLHGRTTQQMRSLLNISPDTPEEQLFTQDTLFMLHAEDSWSRSD